MRYRCLSLICVALVCAACASIRLAKPRITADACSTAPALLGSWTDARMTALGPAWVRVTFASDCTFDMRIQLLWWRLTERGQYRTDANRIHFERQAGQTVWPYQIDGGRLHLTESPKETHVYRR